MTRKIFTEAKLKDTYARIKLRLNESMEQGREIVKKKTPEDTFGLSKAIVTKKSIRLWPIIKASIEIQEWTQAEEYAPYVEYGIPWQQRSYYKNSWRVRGDSPFLTSSSWARMFSWSVDTVRKIIINKLR